MFGQLDVENMYLVEGYYNRFIVVLSFLIAFGASYTAVFINRRIKGKGFFNKNLWLVLASLAMGLGIWSMHYIGMSAFVVPLPMEYDLWMTIASILPAVLASYIAFYLANGSHKKIQTYIVAGVFMGCGITVMHYLGMAAMEIDAEYIYDPMLFSLSVAIAIIASFISLYFFSLSSLKMDKVWVQSVVAMILAIGVTSMHYTGMVAIKFYTMQPVSEHVHGNFHSMTSVVIYVTIGICSLFLIAYLANRLDKYVDHRVKNFDALTQLPNQNQFTEDQRIDKNSQLVAIVHLHNLEKYISAYGYSFGDEIVKSVLQLMHNILPKHTKIYRTEANRFTLMHASDESVQNTLIGLERVCVLLQRPIVVNDRMIAVEMVCAVSRSEERKSIHEHFANAIAVLQAPSTQYKHEIVMYNPKVHTFNFERQLSLDIQRAMDNDELFVVYQPKVDPIKQVVVGAEALIRWHHPVFGMVSPAVFVPILETTERIADVTDWLIGKVLQQIARWNKQNIPIQQVSINIPGMYLTSPRLKSVLNEKLLEHHVDPEQVELEITETSIIHDIQNAILAVSNYRKKGLSIALDDFGTGLSSLSYLKEIPVSTIKIDKSFVDGVPNSVKDASILQSIISLCYSLDLNVVIEGVEHADQIEFIKGLEKAPVVQGYYYSKPLTVGEFGQWFEQQQVIEV